MLNQAALLSKIRNQYLNEPEAGFWTDDELNNLIDSAIIEYQKHAKCYVKEIEINSDDYTTIADLEKPRGLKDLEYREPIERFKLIYDGYTKVKLDYPAEVAILEYFALDNSKDGSLNYLYSDNIDDTAICAYVCKEAYIKETNMALINFYEQMFILKIRENLTRNRRR